VGFFDYQLLKERQIDSLYSDGEDRLNAIQEVVRSILVGSTTEKTLIPLIFELASGLLVFTPSAIFSA
jgi:hypothetical protein